MNWWYRMPTLRVVESHEHTAKMYTSQIDLSTESDYRREPRHSHGEQGEAGWAHKRAPKVIETPNHIEEVRQRSHNSSMLP